MNGVEVTKLLLESGAKPDVDADDRSTALGRAAENGSLEIAKLLLSHGANVNYGRKGVTSALCSAARVCSRELIELFLSHGADVNHESKLYGPPLCCVARWGAPEIELFQSKNTHVSGKGADYRSVSQECIKLLLTHGADAKYTSRKHRSALFHTAEHGTAEAAVLLIEHGAYLDVTFPSDFRYEPDHTPLSNAIRCDNTDIALVLLERGADPKAVIRRAVKDFNLALKMGRKHTSNFKTCCDLLEFLVANSNSFEYGTIDKHFGKIARKSTGGRAPRTANSSPSCYNFSWGEEVKSCLLPCLFVEVRCSYKQLRVCRMLLQHGVTETFSDIFEVIHWPGHAPRDESEFHTVELTRLMRLAGVQFKDGSRSLTRLNLDLSGYESYLAMVDAQLTTVLSLQDCCVMRVRSSLGGCRIWRKIDTLPLPKPLKDLLKLTMF